MIDFKLNGTKGSGSAHFVVTKDNRIVLVDRYLHESDFLVIIELFTKVLSEIKEDEHFNRTVTI